MKFDWERKLEVKKILSFLKLIVHLIYRVRTKCIVINSTLLSIACFNIVY